MADASNPSIRLFVEASLAPGTAVSLTPAQWNYLVNVLRLEDGDALCVFDGQSGEWRARLRILGKKTGELALEERLRGQPRAADLWYLFAPLKHARLDYMVQKATEMGASRLIPVITRRTQATRVNLERMRANAIEAAEQCGAIALPEIIPERRLEAVLEDWPPARRLVFCDESAGPASPLATLRGIEQGPLAVLIGPEGGFDAYERERLQRCPFVTPISLGPRILRADTAAVAALALVQAVLGDWPTP